MIIAGFDLATRSGAAVMDGEMLLHAEAFRPSGDTDGAIFGGFRSWFRALLVSHSVQHVGIEQALPTDIQVEDTKAAAAGKPGLKRNPLTMKTYLRLYGLRAHAIEICASLNIGCEEIHQMSWRKAFLGNGRADKAAAVAQCGLLSRQRGWPEIKLVDACEAVGVAWALAGQLRIAQLHRPGDLFAQQGAA